MIINKVYTEQFAGLNDKKVEFDSGLNLLVGENESGKSTIVDLMYQTLFQGVKLSKKSDKDFIGKYTPHKTAGDQDFIQGELVLSNDHGEYKLTKEWGTKNSSAKLITPEGNRITNEAKINTTITEILGYKKGVFDEVVFASQKRNSEMLDYVLNGGSLSKNSTVSSDLKSTLRHAMIDMGGINIDELEKSLDKKVKSYEGRWNFRLDQPEDNRGINNRWKGGTGSIVESFYNYKESEKLYNDADELEKRIESMKKDLNNKKENKNNYESKQKNFRKFSTAIENRKSNLKLKQESEEKLKKYQFDHDAWPKVQTVYDEAEDLSKKQSLAEVRDLYKNANPVNEKIESLNEQLEGKKEVKVNDLEKLQSAEKKIEQLESQLKGLNLVTKIKNLGNQDIVVENLIDHQTVDIASGEVKVTEAIRIYIPGVIDLQLLPEGVNVEEINENLAKQKEIQNDICLDYGVENAKELSDLSEKFEDRNTQTELLNRTLNGKVFEELVNEYSNVPVDLEETSVIKQEIRNLCGYKDLKEFKGNKEAEIKKLVDNYSTTEALNSKIDDEKENLSKYETDLEKTASIPEEYMNVKDPENYMVSEIKQISDECNYLETQIALNEDKLGNNSAEELLDDLTEKENAFKKTKEDYSNWNTIYNKFIEQKNAMEGNPVEDIEKNFKKYLGIITGEKISLDGVNSDMKVEGLSSGNNVLSANILSEGTRDTISLAYRLAMLEHLFPDGGGIAVFDDPFTDMDEERCAKACELINEFAKNNQVIFVTCDHKYEKLLDGNIVKFE